MKNTVLLVIVFFLTISICGSNELVTNHSKEAIVRIESDSVFATNKSSTIKPVQSFNHNLFNDLLQKNVSFEGNVDYVKFKKDWHILKQYIRKLAANVPSNVRNETDKLAYWINAYNALTIDLVLRHPGIKSIKDIDRPWHQRLWKLGTKWYSLDEIEHQILRKMGEPRIHFAIVCASESCPKLQREAFTASNLNKKLSKATREFLADSSKNIISNNNLKLSKIFKWFSKDFKKDQSLIDFLNIYSDVHIAQNASLSYMDYNWSLND